MLEVRDETALESLTPALEELAGAESARLFNRVSDTDLVRLGVDADSLPIVRLLTSEAHLEAMAKMLPGGQYDAWWPLRQG